MNYEFFEASGIAEAMEKLRQKLAERDERVAEARKSADEDRLAIEEVGTELLAMYADPAELARHARAVDVAEVVENEYNLNIPRYVDTFEPEDPIDVNEALKALTVAEKEREHMESELRRLLGEAGYAI